MPSSGRAADNVILPGADIEGDPAAQSVRRCARPCKPGFVLGGRSGLLTPVFSGKLPLRVPSLGVPRIIGSLPCLRICCCPCDEISAGSYELV
mmetsp:Transcript_88129/g.121554  ORF Transcript_88129/g.121554 Transcript_88129/m.121554 type:complete len:93 (+) Transcript_88129:345-623(+)